MKLKIYIGNIYNLVDYGINGKAGGRMYLQFAGYVAPMGYDGMYGKEEPVGNLLVSQSFHYMCYYLFLSI